MFDEVLTSAYQSFKFQKFISTFNTANSVEVLKKIEEIEKKLERGEDVRKEFWKIAGEIKRLQTDEEIIERASRIRDQLFQRRIILSFKSGFALFLTLFIAFNLLFFHVSTSFEDSVAKALMIFGIEVGTIYTSFLVGRCVGSIVSGINVDGFYRYSVLEFGVKMNYRDYLRAEPIKRVILFSSALILEHFILALHTVYLIPVSDFWVIPAFFLVINLPVSYIIHRKAKTGELHRLLREMKIMKESEQGRDGF